MNNNKLSTPIIIVLNQIFNEDIFTTISIFFKIGFLVSIILVY